MPRSSAIRAILRQSGQVACQRSGTNVAVRAEEQFAPNRPIFKVFLLYISMRWDIDPGSVRAARAAFGTASDSLFFPFCPILREGSSLVDDCTTASRRTPKRTFPRLIRFVQNPIESITDKEMRLTMAPP